MVAKKDRAEFQSIGDERRKLRSLLCDQRENIDRYLYYYILSLC